MRRTRPMPSSTILKLREFLSELLPLLACRAYREDLARLHRAIDTGRPEIAPSDLKEVRIGLHVAMLMALLRRDVLRLTISNRHGTVGIREPVDAEAIPLRPEGGISRGNEWLRYDVLRFLATRCSQFLADSSAWNRPEEHELRRRIEELETIVLGEFERRSRPSPLDGAFQSAPIVIVDKTTDLTQLKVQLDKIWPYIIFAAYTQSHDLGSRLAPEAGDICELWDWFAEAEDREL